jgi:hypothetical protein
MTFIEGRVDALVEKKAGTRGWSRHFELAGRPDKNRNLNFKSDGSPIRHSERDTKLKVLPPISSVRRENLKRETLKLSS